MSRHHNKSFKKYYPIPTIRKRVRCTWCGHEDYIIRKKSKDKPVGHIKHMYCPVCGKVRAHVELGRMR
jgi:ribosomal protein L33